MNDDSTERAGTHFFAFVTMTKPPAHLRCCGNCRHWHRRDYIHCQCSGPWGGNIPGDPRCTFSPKTPRLSSADRDPLKKADQGKPITIGNLTDSALAGKTTTTDKNA